MDVLLLVLELLLLGFGAGTLVSMTGLGGGILMIPAMVLLLGLPTKAAIGSTVIAVVATSSAAAVVYAERHITNLRLGMFLEMFTTIGGVSGTIITIFLSPNILNGIFSIFMLYAALYLLWRRDCVPPEGLPVEGQCDQDRLALACEFRDEVLGREIHYAPKRLTWGSAISFVAGSLSGMLGVGGGIIKVPMMNAIMKVPMKAAAATSNFMIGVTAVASAYIYYTRGYVVPLLTGPVVVGILLGSILGSTLVAKRLSGDAIRKIVVVLLLVSSFTMMLKATGSLPY